MKMANVKKNKFEGMYVVIPRTNEGYKELYCKANGKTIPFGTPVHLTDQDIIAIENQKEATKSSGYSNPYEQAKMLGISIDEVMARQEKLGPNAISSTDELTWRNRYDIQKA